jgi:heme-degrading monooxygenase HmoA
MDHKTSVSGHRVTIDDANFEIKPAGTDRYAVFDEFGGALGYFMVHGRAVKVDDYGVEGAPPMMVIGRAWVAAAHAEPVVVRPSHMVCRIATSEGPTEAEVEAAKAHAAWLKQQPGAKAAFVAHDATSGKMLSVSVWSSQERLTAALEKPAPEGAAEPGSAKLEILPMAADL